MTSLVALEAKLGIAFKAIVSVLATKNAIRTAPLIRTLASHMSEFLTVAAFDCWVALSVVPSLLILQSAKHVILHRIIFLASLLDRLVSTYLTVCSLRLLFVGIDVLAEIHVAFNRSTWDYQVWIALRIDRSDVVVSIVSTSQSVSAVGGCFFSLAFIEADALGAWLPILSIAHPILGKELFLVMILGTRMWHIVGLRYPSRILSCEQSGIQHGPTLTSTTTFTFLVVSFVKGRGIVLPDHARHPVWRGVNIALGANWAFSFFTPD